MIAIIGGTGVGGFPLEGEPQESTVQTAWGTATVRVGRLHGKTVVFLARHGHGHSVPPHRINYRANIAALAKLGVRAVFATNAVGSLTEEFPPGDLLVLDDLIDFTRDRSGKTFFDGEDGTPVVHTDLTRPYSEEARLAIMGAADAADVRVQAHGTYLCNDGPRYETAAEVRLFAQWGAHVAGMTGVPEAQLAREAGIHYAAVALVTNLGAGISKNELTHTEVEETFRAARPRLTALLVEAVQRIETDSLPPIGPGVPIPL
ncbi:MAG: S-methyl-5'-thioadenosine phosphorylase [Armatimonadaceae bacterium]